MPKIAPHHHACAASVVRRAAIVVFIGLLLVAFPVRAVAQTSVDPDPAAEAGTKATTTSRPALLVPGPVDLPQDGQDATANAGVTGAASTDDPDRTELIVGLVIGGLLVAALLIGVLTYRFWHNTKQKPPPTTEPPARAEPRHLARAGR